VAFQATPEPPVLVVIVASGVAIAPVPDGQPLELTSSIARIITIPLPEVPHVTVTVVEPPVVISDQTYEQFRAPVPPETAFQLFPLVSVADAATLPFAPAQHTTTMLPAVAVNAPIAELVVCVRPENVARDVGALIDAKDYTS